MAIFLLHKQVILLQNFTFNVIFVVLLYSKSKILPTGIRIELQHISFQAGVEYWKHITDLKSELGTFLTRKSGEGF